MTRLTYIDTESHPRRRFSGSWMRVADAGLRRNQTLLLTVAALWRFLFLGAGEMRQWDEAIYALRVRVVLQFGELWDQSAHMLAGSYYSAHPPLYVWLSTFWTLLLGDVMWTHRLTSALAGAGLVFLSYRVSRKALPVSLSLAVAFFVAWSPLLAEYSVLGQLDMLLALCMFVALAFGAHYVRTGRSRYLAWGGLLLGAALMTKMLFALTISVAMAAACLLLRGDHRKRAGVFALAATAISLPLWVPWLVSFSLQHGQGNLLYLFSSATPLGATLAGQEGTVKDTGFFFYANQLMVHGSALLPFTVFALWRSLRGSTSILLTVLGVWMLVQTAALLVAGSAFEVYLIPLVAPLAIFGVKGVQLTRRTSVTQRRALLMASALCFAWSLSQSWRFAVKSLLGVAQRGAVDGDVLLDAAMLIAVAASGIALAWRVAGSTPAKRVFSSSTLYGLALILAVVCVWNFIVVRPDAMRDGAESTAAFVRSSDASYVALIGNGDNPQLTWYLNGADIGWGANVKSYERLEPHTRGNAAIVERLRHLAREHRTLAVIERVEIAKGIYRSPGDVLPDGFRIVVTTRRYIVAASFPAVSPTSSGSPRTR